jgi:hypothetical protein
VLGRNERMNTGLQQSFAPVDEQEIGVLLANHNGSYDGDIGSQPGKCLVFFVAKNWPDLTETSTAKVEVTNPTEANTKSI